MHQPCECSGTRFNPRPRAGSDAATGAVRRRGSVAVPPPNPFQSTPPRGKRQWTDGLAIHPFGRPCGVVSIHAPAREATRAVEFQSTPTAGDSLDQGASLIGFQSTPPRGKRQQRSMAEITPTPAASAFQSTPPRGKRLGPSRPSLIHAPAREAIAPRHAPSYSFNPRPRAGSDLAGIAQWPRGSTSFQSTPPRGKRLCHRNSIWDRCKSAILREHSASTGWLRLSTLGKRERST